MKANLKRLIKRFPIPLSRNHKYDLQTRKVIRRNLTPTSNTIDVGCHKGEIFELLLNAAPEGHHWGFEPIPYLFEGIKKKYDNHPNCNILPFALSDRRQFSDFNHVISNPSYSGLKKRRYDRKYETAETIQVQTELLDNIIPREVRIDFIKIDVEGGEYQVLLGAHKLIEEQRPLIIFEHGLGSSEYYGSTPDKIFSYFEQMKMKVSTLDSFLKKGQNFDRQEFEEQYFKNVNYYFIAYS